MAACASPLNCAARAGRAVTRQRAATPPLRIFAKWRPSPLDDHTARTVAVNLLGGGYSPEVAAHLIKIEAAGIKVSAPARSVIYAQASCKSMCAANPMPARCRHRRRRLLAARQH